MTPAADKAGPPERLNGPDLGLAMLAVGAGSMDVFGFFALGARDDGQYRPSWPGAGAEIRLRFRDRDDSAVSFDWPLHMTLSTAKNTRFSGKIGADAVFLVNVKGLRSTAWDRPREGEKMPQRVYSMLPYGTKIHIYWAIWRLQCQAFCQCQRPQRSFRQPQSRTSRRRPCLGRHLT